MTGQFTEASAALRAFARGRFDGYRREDTALLLDWLAKQRSDEGSVRSSLP